MILKETRGRYAILAGVVVVALIVSLPLLSRVAESEPRKISSQSATPPSNDEPIEDLTGEEVGLALGLTPIEGDEPVLGCAAFAEYGGDEVDAGFCISDAVDDPVEQVIISYQIRGYARTEVVEEYARAVVDFEDGPSNQGSSESTEELRRLMDLAQEIRAQGIVEDD